MSFAVKEVEWLVNLLAEFGCPQHQSVAFYCDSTAAIHIANNPVLHERTKHLERDCHKVHDKVIAGLIKTLHVRTMDQLAYVFTKALHPGHFHSIIGKMSLLSICMPS